MNDPKIKAVLLAHGFKEKHQGDGRMDLNPYVYTAIDALLAGYVRKFKFETLVEHSRRLEAELAQARAHVNEVTLYQENAVWFWQHDGEDYLDSLSCPIIIQPHQMRDILAGAISADVAALQASLTLAREQRDQEIQLNAELRAKIPDIPYTYTSSQATQCAGCGTRKHTPLRVDPMGGYVCLTCIDQRLEGLLAEESARDVEKDWDGCQELADLPAVHQALQAFSGDPTGDGGVLVVKAVIDALARGYIALTPAELQSGYDRVKWAEGLIRQLPLDHEGRNSWLMNYAEPDTHLTQPGALEWDAGPGVPE